MGRLITNMVDRMILDGTIEEEDKEIYEYGLTQGIIMLFNIVVTILIGVFLHMFFETLLFMAVYMPLRSYAGGVHAKTQLRCFFYSFGIVFVVLFVIKYFPSQLLYTIGLLIFSTITVCCLAPVEAENKPLDDDEVKYYGKKARRLLLFYDLIALITLVFKIRILYVSISVTLATISVTLLLGFRYNKKRKKLKKSEEK